MSNISFISADSVSITRVLHASRKDESKIRPGRKFASAEGEKCRKRLQISGNLIQFVMPINRSRSFTNKDETRHFFYYFS